MAYGKLPRTIVGHRGGGVRAEYGCKTLGNRCRAEEWPGEAIGRRAEPQPAQPNGHDWVAESLGAPGKGVQRLAWTRGVPIEPGADTRTLAREAFTEPGALGQPRLCDLGLVDQLLRSNPPAQSREMKLAA